MTATFMLDSDQLDAFPVGIAELLATYSDLVPTTASLRAFEEHHRFAKVLLIDRGEGDPTGLASIADVEKLALKVGELRGWFERKQAAGIEYLTAYSDRSTLPAIDAALKGLHPWHWVATLDGTVVIDPLPALRRPAVVQCFTSAMLGIHCDGSLRFNDRWNA